MTKAAKKDESEWMVFLLRKKARPIGRVRAATKEEALQRAYDEFEVAPADRFRISVQPVG